MMGYMIRVWMLVMLGAAVSGCAAEREFIRVSCVPEGVAAAPTYADAGTAVVDAPDPGSRYQIIATANEQKSARLAVVEPVIQGCR